MAGSPLRCRIGVPPVAAPRRALVFLLGCALALSPACGPASAADDIGASSVPGGNFQAVRDALIESIEEEGLVVSAVIPFNDMLQRTAAASASNAVSPFIRAEIVQFCSSRIAWQLLAEDRAQIALCPLSISIQQTREAPAQVRLAWRLTGGSTPGRMAADALLERLVRRAEALAR